MATHALTTSTLLAATPQERVSLLGTQQARRSLLRAGSERAAGPVTLAIRAVRSASTLDPWQATQDDERRALRELRERIAGGLV